MPTTLEAIHSGQANGSATLPVGAMIDIAREWVELHARHQPDFAGAYLWGGITALPEDAPFHLYRDVDLVIVSTTGSKDTPLEVFYCGVMFEVILMGVDEHQDPHAVLANPSHAPNIAATRILADPSGILAPLQQRVKAEYAHQRWVRARCEAEKVMADEALANMRQASAPVDGLDPLWLFLYALSGLLAVAQLKRPTTRRTLCLLGELLDDQGRPDLHEAALSLWGSAHMSRADVEAILAQSAVAYDRACAVYRTPTPFGFTLRPHLRPYYVEASREMIDAGQHREAMFWIMAVFGEAYLALQNDAPDAEKPLFATQLQAMHTALGFTSSEPWSRRVEAAKQLKHEVYRIADDLVALHP